jgi:thioredoxin reductase
VEEQLETKLKSKYDVFIIGAGPAGLSAGIAAHDNGADTLLVEREARSGGILKQCIHDGFGIITFKEKLSGPEYAERFIKEVKKRNINLLTSTYVTKIERKDNSFKIFLVNSLKGVIIVESKTIIIASGCRERTAKQVFITGTRPAGIYTAGTAQYFVNILGYLPSRKCVVLGSGDIGLIMARRLTLEGAEVVGVYEAKSTPSGLSRNIAQCLEDYSIPLYLSHTITKVFGTEHVEGVEIARVDDKMQPIKGTEHIVLCDGVILSVGLIPENELAESLDIQIDNNTKGPVVNENFMTSVDGVFSCGNALHVNDLVDYVTENGMLAGEAAAKYCFKNTNSETYVAKTGGQGDCLCIEASNQDFLYVVPQKIINKSYDKKTTIYFRAKKEESKVVIKLLYNEKIIFSKKYDKLRPTEMEKIVIKFMDFIDPGAEDRAYGIKLIMSR